MVFRPPQGIIALDIDGTLTADTDLIPYSVQMYLQNWQKRGWAIIFITGRPFQWSFKTLQSLDFPYALAVQNGAYLLEMPSKKILSSRLLNIDILKPIQTLCQQFQTGGVVYAGYAEEDWCYYVPSDFSLEMQDYFKRRNAKLKEKWQALTSFNQLPIKTFASFKCFAKENLALSISQAIESKLDFHAPPNRDPFDRNYFVVQATHNQATKGEALNTFKQLIGCHGPVIAAGDDYNDRSMLMEANVKIVMANAPQDLLNLASIIAPPASQNGLVQGLEEAKNFLDVLDIEVK